MINFYPETPQGKAGEVKVGYAPAKVALARLNDENALVSSILLLTHDTTELEVAAVGQGIAGKWISRADVDASIAGTSVITIAGTANFDFTVPVSTQRRVVVPISTFTPTSGSVMGINRKLGLFPAIAFKTLAGTGSVLVAEF